LVTFIACEIVTGCGLTEILGSRPAGFPPQSLTGDGQAFQAKPAEPSLPNAALRQNL
jgi:hypothetical protein